MAKKSAVSAVSTRTVVANDVVSSILDLLSKPVENTKIVKTDMAAIMLRIKENEQAMLAESRGIKEITQQTKAKRTERQEAIRIAFSLACSNIPAAELKDRSEKGIADLKEKMNQLRFSINSNNYPIESIDKKYITKEGKVKWAMLPETKDSWNKESQLIRQIELFGWNEVCPKGQALPHAEVQVWSFDSEGVLLKEKPAQQENAPVISDPIGAVEAALHTLVVRLAKLDLTSTDGASLLDKAMMQLVQVKTGQLAKAELSKAKAAKK